MSRNLLHVHAVGIFVAWLGAQGIACRAGRGEYELWQVNLDGCWASIYRRNCMPEHVTVDRRLDDLVLKFLGEKGK